MKKKKERKNMQELTKGYESFIVGKETKKIGKQLFTKTIEKASKPKPRSSK